MRSGLVPCMGSGYISISSCAIRVEGVEAMIRVVWLTYGTKDQKRAATGWVTGPPFSFVPSAVYEKKAPVQEFCRAQPAICPRLRPALLQTYPKDIREIVPAQNYVLPPCCDYSSDITQRTRPMMVPPLCATWYRAAAAGNHPR